MSSKGSLKKNKKIEKTSSDTLAGQIGDYLLKMLTSLYVFLMLVVYPLYMEQKYTNMGEAKYHFFYYVSVFFLGALLITYIVSDFARGKKDTRPFKPTVTFWFCCAFFVISSLSFICVENLSTNFNVAFKGYSGWNMGYLSQVMFVVIFFFVAYYWEWSPLTIICACVTSGIVYLIAVLQRFDLDIFRLYWNYVEDYGGYIKLADEYIEKFVSTLGQTTWYSSYAVLLFPFGIELYYLSRKSWHKILCAILIMLGSASISTVNSDSGYVALMLIIMVFFWYSVEKNDLFTKFLETSICILLSFRVVGIFQNLFPERMIRLITGTEGISKFVNHSRFMTIVTILVIVIYLAWKVVLYRDENNSSSAGAPGSIDISKFKWIRIVMVACAGFVIIIAPVLIVLTTKHLLPDFMSSLYNIGFLTFDDLWGNCRGFNWKASAVAFVNSSFKDFLIGVGPDCFFLSMNKHYYAEMVAFWGNLQLACAHNEWLNMLITEGILGLTAYLGIFISSAIRLGKAANKEPMAVPCLAAIIAYIGHNFFCYQQCICTPTIFIIMGIGEIAIREALKNDNN